METKRTITVKLSEKELKDILLEKMKVEFPNAKDYKVHLNIGTISTGYGISERDQPVFKGVNIEIEG